ncbi:ParA family protein [Longibacter salinarum]|nr:ParA family protein [Longibacter salinarum]
MLTTIPIINNKGGVGKTTTAVNVAAGLAQRGRRVLLVDLDSQGSASIALGVHHDNLRPSSADVLFGHVAIDDAIRETGLENVDLITGSLSLADAGTRLKLRDNGQYRLRNVLSTVKDWYQTIIIDCAPSTSILSVNALVGADAIIVPVAPSYLAMEGVISLGKTVRRVREGIGEAAPILGVLLTMVSKGDDRAVDEINELRSHYGGKVFKTEIQNDPALKVAPSAGVDIFRYAPDSPGATDYDQLIDEIEERLQRYGSIYGNLPSRASTGTYQVSNAGGIRS